jgi:hypothetical protein
MARPWNHKRVCRICCALELNLRIKPRKRLKRDKPDALAVPEAPKHDLVDGIRVPRTFGSWQTDWGMVGHFGC